MPLVARLWLTEVSIGASVSTSHSPESHPLDSLPRGALNRSMRRLWSRGLTFLLAAGVLIGLAGCGLANSETKQEIASLNQQLQTPGLGAGMFGQNADIGVPIPTVAWVAGPSRTVTVLRASLIALRGFKLPRLVSVGVVPGCAGSDNDLFPTSNDQDQIGVTANGRQLQLLPLAGDRMRTGNARCAPAFVYTVVSSVYGEYAAGGLQLTVQAGNQTQIVRAWRGVFVWYGGSPSTASFNQQCDAAAAAQKQLYNASH